MKHFFECNPIKRETKTTCKYVPQPNKQNKRLDTQFSLEPIDASPGPAPEQREKKRKRM